MVKTPHLSARSEKRGRFSRCFVSAVNTNQTSLETATPTLAGIAVRIYEWTD